MGLFSNNRSIVDIFIKLLASLVVIFLISPLHEYAHGYVAYKLGDNTAKNSGRLTLNPIAHLDILGAIGIILVGFGWASPVPVNSRNFKNPKSGMALTALAGPVSNFLGAFVGCVILNIVSLFNKNFSAQIFSAIVLFISYYINLNVGIGAFNLIPVPPLDGSRIIAYFMSDKAVYNFYIYQRQLSLVLIVVLFSGLLDVPLNIIRSFFLNGIVWLASLPFGG